MQKLCIGLVLAGIFGSSVASAAEMVRYEHEYYRDNSNSTGYFRVEPKQPKAKQSSQKTNKQSGMDNQTNAKQDNWGKNPEQTYTGSDHPMRALGRDVN